MVVPRQTCGIWTHTNRASDFLKNRTSTSDAETASEARRRVHEVVRTIVYNPVNVFMTHWTNYASDRLAIELFRRVFTLVRQSTRLRLLALPPLDMARKYFQIFPDDREFLWTNVCADRKLLAIWRPLNSTRLCANLPRFIILGPQKTGKRFFLLF